MFNQSARITHTLTRYNHTPVRKKILQKTLHATVNEYYYIHHSHSVLQLHLNCDSANVLSFWLPSTLMSFD